jgi:hypothetical protein
VSAAGTNGHPTWLPTDASALDCEFELVRNIAPQTGLQSQFIAGAGCGIRNRGLDFGGHAFIAGEAYTGHLFAKGDSASTVEVSLADWSTNTTLATQTLVVPAGEAWGMHNFTLMPSADTSCSTTAVGADRYKTCAGNAENLCPICKGEFRINVLYGAVLLDQVFLEQVSLRFDDQPTRSTVVSLMKDTMGFGVIRNGGSQCNSEGYRWKRFRGNSKQALPISERQREHGRFSLRPVGLISMFFVFACVVATQGRRMTDSRLMAPGTRSLRHPAGESSSF